MGIPEVEESTVEKSNSAALWTFDLQLFDFFKEEQ